jgi:hypothetical protein
MPRTWDRSRFAPWLLRELVQVNEKPRGASAAYCSRVQLRDPERKRGTRQLQRGVGVTVGVAVGVGLGQ